MEPRHAHIDILRTMGAELLYLCLDIADATPIAMLLKERHSQAASVCLPGGAGISFVSKTKRRQKFSSYAVLATSAVDEDAEGPIAVNDVPTTDPKLVSCANCGGLLDPTTMRVDSSDRLNI